MELKGTRALVTGASQGIGRAIALTLAREEAAWVGVGYRSQVEKARHVVDEIQAAGSRAIFLPGDVGVQEQAEGVVLRFIAEAGGIDILVNNAGGPAPGRIDTISPEEWDRALRVLIYGAFWCTRIAVPVMMSQRRGRILNISSIVARRGIAGNVAYCTGKSALIGFTQSLARELADYNILVNELAPGLTDTDMHAQVSAEVRRHNVDTRIPLHRYGTTEDMAEAALFLLRHDYITGEVLGIDGGLGMRLA